MPERRPSEPSKEDIRVLYAEEEKASPGSRFGPVVRSIYIVECCTGGRGTVIINGKEFENHAGQSYVLLPGDTVVHTSDRNQPRKGYWCALDGISVGTHLQQIGITSEKPFLPAELFEDIRWWMEQLTIQWQHHDAGALLRQTAYAYGLLGAILQNTPSTKKSTLIDKAIGIMQANYTEPLNISDLAQQVGLERTYFSEQFKEITGISPYQYLTRLRIQKACQLISQGYSITQTAYLVGMEPHNFGRVFKKEIGKSPREYLNKVKRYDNDLVARHVHVLEE